MCEEVNITQRAALGSETTQIGVQNNYIGLTPEEVSQLALKLFLDNFPRLQREAHDVAVARVNELWETISQKLSRNDFANYGVFAEPDMQYALVEAQKGYARFASNILLDMLSELVATRSNAEEDFVLKVTLDKAISVACMLKPEHLDYLSLVFIGKHVVIDGLSSVDELIGSITPYLNLLNPSDIKCVEHLVCLNCMQLNIGSPLDRFQEQYPFDKNELKEKYPPIFSLVSKDYGLSLVGKALAITNLQNKGHVSLNYSSWISD